MADSHSTEERWRPVVGWETHYEVSDHGRVRRLVPYRKVATELKTTKRSTHYPTVTLHRHGTEKHHAAVHVLVCEAFIGPRPDGYHVNHIDGNKQHNHVSNLEYVTAGDNARHAVQTGLNDVIGEGNAAAKLTDEQVLEMRRRYRPYTCTIPMLAREYGVSHTQVSDSLRGKSWRHLDATSEPSTTVIALIVEILRERGQLRAPAILDALHDRGYRPRRANVTEIGVVRTLLSRANKQGLIVRLVRGLYTLPTTKTIESDDLT